ncbi:multimerin-2-like [Protopterus annectens]|uniref:multimerin-2-like n=1 Tax=Protopterus annectens TaxID=7888 RepID=UPI001CFC195B|nr:multimerin-2-like [Protopterus annectens]
MEQRLNDTNHVGGASEINAAGLTHLWSPLAAEALLLFKGGQRQMVTCHSVCMSDSLWVCWADNRCYGEMCFIRLGIMQDAPKEEDTPVKLDKRLFEGTTHVYFFASCTTALSNSVNTIRFNNVFLNIGQSYNPVTGIFTCPISGVYQFFFSTNFGRGKTTNLWLVHDGKKVIISHTDMPGHTSPNLQMALLYIKKWSHVWIEQSSGQSWSSPTAHTTTFGGILLHAMP